GLFLVIRKESFKITLKQAGILVVAGLLYTGSSLFLFESYKYIPSGLATMLIYVSPAMVAVIMVFLRVVPSWPVWLAIAAAFFGVMLMTKSDGTIEIDAIGVALSLASALVYSFFIVIINKNATVGSLSSTMLTFYSLCVGTIVFAARLLASGRGLTDGLNGSFAWLNLVGLAIFPTIVATATLAISSRNIGATKASVLSVFEPITAIVIGTAVFGEILTTNIVVGIVIAISAVTFMIMKTKR
ncbi:MAG: DMT family transporter, partial [Bacteroidales bacterium]|nr:DMT family transporter [Bacteroidales bacterium]